ncbi:type I glyceraldehyde-3-phosphate dehydrogenase, partial [Patescibacteria group bacterium]|nr:type I glyceraldehyde-3-phosphate dehydrogenase [Patescibacteria group bacterium]
MLKIAINGFGRIGRTAFKIAYKRKGMKVAAINDLSDKEMLAYLLKYDSVFGRYDKKVKIEEDGLLVEGEKIPCLAESDPAKLPWKDLGVDVALECTGAFADTKKSKAHLDAGAKRVIISAPPKDDTPIFCMGCNQKAYKAAKQRIISNGSCTTNCLAPVAKVLNDEIGIDKALMTTIHSYTATQNLVDGPNKDFQRARAAALNIVPSTTGAAIAVTRVLPELEGKFDGMAVRVPSPCVSLVDLVVKLRKSATLERINNLFINASRTSLKGILAVEKAPLVSTDYVGSVYSAIVDMEQTMVTGGDLVKVIAWYDNEWGYS